MFETHQGITSVPSGSGIGRRSDMYGGDPIPGYEFNYSMAGSWEAPAPQPQSHSGYMRVSVSIPWLGRTIRLSCHPMKPVQYNNVEQGGINYAGYASPFPAPTMSLPPLLSGAYTAPNYQGAFPIWHFFGGWVSYAAQDELHVTIILRRFPSV